LITDRRAGTFKVKCAGCELQTKPSLYRSETVGAWNTRASLAPADMSKKPDNFDTSSEHAKNVDVEQAHRDLIRAERDYWAARNSSTASTFNGRCRTEEALARLNAARTALEGGRRCG
jgi:hypothetical protein